MTLDKLCALVRDVAVLPCICVMCGLTSFLFSGHGDARRGRHCADSISLALCAGDDLFDIAIY